MDKIELRNDLALSLQKMYDMEVFSSMMEFCQGELRVLQYLEINAGSEIYPSNLSDALNVTRQRITSILSSLRKKGYVSMEMADNDRRKMRVILTDTGKNKVVSKGTMIMNYFDILIDELGEKNIIELTRLINLTNDQFEQLKIRNE